MDLIRITVTVPAALVRKADQLARREGRSRSWVVSDALRQRFAATANASPPPIDAASTSRAANASAAPRTATSPDDPFAAARTGHVGAELSLNPAIRLARAEQLGELARERQGRGTREQVIAFDSYDDFYQWKAARLIGA